MTGNRNSGKFNSGHFNSGKFNSGNFNSGKFNSGYYNSGKFNSGYYNSGHFNSGKFNSGYYNSGNFNSGHFNTTTPDKIRLFNTWIDIDPNEVIIPYIELPLTEWTDSGLITRSYHEAWAIAWESATLDKKNEFLNLPGFNAEIFKEITGIDVTLDEDLYPQTCTPEGSTVTIDGVEYVLIRKES